MVRMRLGQSRQRLGAALVASLLMGCANQVELPEAVQAFSDKLPETVDYNLHVKPILSDRCFKCHGPDKNKIEAGLQLAHVEGATQTLKSGATAIDPGNPAGSELVKRILSTDPDEIMPTPDSHLALSDEEKALLIKWIEQGADYKEHWSLTPIKQPDVPRVGDSWPARWGLVQDEQTRWVRNEIDHFVLAKLTEKGLAPSPEADRATLLRRVSLDLTGLPPTTTDLDRFLRDSSPDAYEKAVDRLLASAHFGEQQAVSWLDLARYADSHGYQDDGLRNAWPYRDWVIRAFNQNKPFDQFVTEQLAGDLLPKSQNDAQNRDRLVATSFNRQHPQTQEGGIVLEEFRTEYVADRANTFGKAFLGLTMECARCHDHKYDPISQKDYYSLFAFFNQNDEHGMVPYRGEAAPTVMLPSPQMEAQLRYIRRHIAQTETRLAPQRYEAGFTRWLQDGKATSTLQNGLLVHLPMDGSDPKDEYSNRGNADYKAVLKGDADRKPVVGPGKVGTGVTFRGDCGLELFSSQVDKKPDGGFRNPKERYGKGLNFERNQPFSVNLWFRPLKSGVQGTIFQRSNFEYEGHRGFSVSLNADRTLRVLFSYVYPTNCIELRTRQPLTLNQWQHLALTYDGSGRADGIGLYRNGQAMPLVVVADHLTKSLLHDQNGENAFGLFRFLIGRDERQKDIADVQMDEFGIHNRRLSDLEIQTLAGAGDVVSKLLDLPANQRTPAQLHLLRQHYLLALDPAYGQALNELDSVRGQEIATVTKVPEVMVMQELPTHRQRQTHLLKRGVYDAPTDEVRAETPLRLGKLPDNYPRNRLGLSRWLLDVENPLFARVMANRLWLQFFERGLVRTQEDFGNQGELPSHPELLDWLAAQYRRDGWNTKAFIRRIVLSATYRQSSKATPIALEQDPDNQWLARGSSYQLSAEQIRDNALVASGLLVKQVGGPSVYPYQPGGIWEALATRNAVNYRQQHGDSLYRRSLYTIWKRTSPPPMMLNFDAPDRSSCTVRRQKTATPLQALITLNDPQFVEAARVLAQHTMKTQPTFDERIRHFFRAALSRPPRPSEKAILKTLYQTEYALFRQTPTRAQALLKTGEYPTNQRLDPVELAAYTVVANTVLNHDEALVKR